MIEKPPVPPRATEGEVLDALEHCHNPIPIDAIARRVADARNSTTPLPPKLVEESLTRLARDGLVTFAPESEDEETFYRLAAPGTPPGAYVYALTANATLWRLAEEAARDDEEDEGQ